MATGFLVDAERALIGLSGTVGDTNVLGLALRERQERAFLEAGLRFQSDSEGIDLSEGGIALPADTFVTADAVRLLEKKGREVGRDLAWKASGVHGAFVEQLQLGRGGPRLTWLAPGGGLDIAARVEAAESVVFDVKERVLSMPVSPTQFGADVIELPISDYLVMPVSHWLQLLWVNLLGLGPFLWRALAGRNVVEVVWRLSWAVVRAGSVHPAKVGAKLGRRGRGVRIHPSAVVEGCWLGDGVEIGANAVVRGSVLADGTKVEELALLEFCVTGRGACVQRHGLAKFSVLGAGCSVAGAMQLGVMEPQAALKWGAALMDMSFDGPVRVAAGDGLVDAPLGLAGVCVGAETIVGTGVRVAPGRALPAGIVVVPPAEDIVRRIPEAAEGLMVVRDGTLVKL